MAMTYPVLCCITAARMEMKRLRVVERHQLVDKPDDVQVPSGGARGLENALASPQFFLVTIFLNILIFFNYLY